MKESGASPNMLVFGREFRLPGSILTGNTEREIGVLSRIEAGDSVLERALQIRHEARKAILGLERSKQIRAAILGRSRPRREFVPGDVVFIWRKHRVSGRGRERVRRFFVAKFWQGLAMVVGCEGQSSVWCNL